MRRNTAFALISATMIVALSACNSDQSSPRVNTEGGGAIATTSDPAQIEQQLKGRLEKLLPYLNDQQRKNLSMIDFERGYEYSLENGLKKVDIGQIDKNTGLVKFSDGAALRPPQSDIDKISTNSLMPLATYEPYLQYRTNYNAHGINGIIKTPTDFGGLNGQGEATYSYMSLFSACTNIEGGVFTSSSVGYTKGRFYTYFNKDGRWLAQKDLPSSGLGFVPGTQVEMTMNVPVDGEVVFTAILLSTGESKSWSTSNYNYPNLCVKADGTNFKLGRTTSLLVNTSGWSRGNTWAALGLYRTKGSYAKTTWMSTYSDPSSPYYRGNAQATNTYPHYQDTINIVAP